MVCLIALPLQIECTHPLVESIWTVSIDEGGDAQVMVVHRHFEVTRVK